MPVWTPYLVACITFHLCLHDISSFLFCWYISFLQISLHLIDTGSGVWSSTSKVPSSGDKLAWVWCKATTRSSSTKGWPHGTGDVRTRSRIWRLLGEDSPGDLDRNIGWCWWRYVILLLKSLPPCFCFGLERSPLISPSSDLSFAGMLRAFTAMQQEETPQLSRAKVIQLHLLIKSLHMIT